MVELGFSTCQERWAVRYVYLYLFQGHNKTKSSMEGAVFIAIS